MNQPAYSSPPTGQLVVTIQGSKFTTSYVVPTLDLDGYRVPSQYGDNLFQLPAGVHRVHLRGEWGHTYGEATLDVQVMPQQRVQVFYAMPLSHWFKSGNIGFQRQPHQGAWIPIALGSFLVAMLVVLLLLM